MKKNLILASLAIMFLFIGSDSLLWGLEDGNQTTTSSSVSKDSPNWAQFHTRRLKAIVDEVVIEVGLGVGVVGTPGVGIKFIGKLVFVNCCKFTGDVNSWCNTTEQHERC